MNRVLVTGGLGFVGSNLVRMLVADHGCDVTIVDDLFTGSRSNIAQIEGVKIVEGSVCDRALIDEVMVGKDTVFHLAARNIIASMSDPLNDMESNIKGTFNVLESALRTNVRKVVYTSTCSVYGNPRVLPICEDEIPKFLNFYSVSKYAGECYAKTFYAVHGLPVVIMRYSNVYGYNQDPINPYCGVIGRFVSNALNNQPLAVHGDGEQTRDFTFVEDACTATILAALDPKSIGAEYNIGTGVETSINRLASEIVRLTNSSSKIIHVDRRDIDNIRRRVVNIEKSRQQLRFFPQYTLDQGLVMTINWLKQKERQSKCLAESFGKTGTNRVR